MSPKITLEQWQTFRCVVDEGSFARAAEKLNKSQSSISYAIGQLNAQLPQPVLRVEGRRSVLTEAGKILYRHAEQLLKQASDAEAVARSLAMGFESEVTLAIDALQDVGALASSFATFSDQFPHTRVRVLETTLSGTTEALLERRADLVITPEVPVGFSGQSLRGATLIPVAAPSHPLCFGLSEVSETELRGHRQLVLRDSGLRRNVDAGWLQAEKRWTVSHFATSIKLLKSGLAFAFVPREWVEDELKTGCLVTIPLGASLDRHIPLYLLLAAKHAAGPATLGLADILIAKLGSSSARGS
jgi:DNA-binding transcriptional LysR family regulator